MELVVHFVASVAFLVWLVSNNNQKVVHSINGCIGVDNKLVSWQRKQLVKSCVLIQVEHPSIVKHFFCPMVLKQGQPVKSDACPISGHAQILC